MGRKLVATRQSEAGGYVIKLNDGTGLFYKHGGMKTGVPLTQALFTFYYDAAVTIQENRPGSEIVAMVKITTTKLVEV